MKPLISILAIFLVLSYMNCSPIQLKQPSYDDSVRKNNLTPKSLLQFSDNLQLYDYTNNTILKNFPSLSNSLILQTLKVDDLDNDKWNDFAILYYSKPPNLARTGYIAVVSSNSGEILFELEGTYSEPINEISLLDDINGDGKKELLVGASTTKIYSLSGTPSEITQLNMYNQFSINDKDGDSKKELAYHFQRLLPSGQLEFEVIVNKISITKNSNGTWTANYSELTRIKHATINHPNENINDIRIHEFGNNSYLTFSKYNVISSSQSLFDSIEVYKLTGSLQTGYTYNHLKSIKPQTPPSGKVASINSYSVGQIGTSDIGVAFSSKEFNLNTPATIEAQYLNIYSSDTNSISSQSETSVRQSLNINYNAIANFGDSSIFLADINNDSKNDIIFSFYGFNTNSSSWDSVNLYYSGNSAIFFKYEIQTAINPRFHKVLN